MPELPEVETVRRGLARSLEGARINHVEVRRKDLRYPFPENLSTSLQGRVIVSFKRRAKYLLIILENDTIVISHLGMSGCWRIEEAGQKQKHDHLILDVATPKQFLRLTYHDPRRFGFVLLTSQSDLDNHPLLRNLGVEPLSNDLSPAMLEAAFKAKKTPLKAALLDQRIIAGLGNIYVCEALWQAQLSPFLAAGWLATGTKKANLALDRLVRAVRDVLNRALQAGGSTLRDYAHIDGTSGYFQHQFSVYGHENAPCPHCNAPILRERQSGRSTFYCAACQPLPANAIPAPSSSCYINK